MVSVITGSRRRDIFGMSLLSSMALVIAFAVSSVVAADPGSGTAAAFPGQESPKHPELGEVPDSYDPNRGESRKLDASDAQQRDPDADQASFQLVFPPDERVRVNQTDQYPMSAIAQIEKYANGQFAGSCTGTFVGPNSVLTAGHCLYMPETGWGDGIAIIPGRDGNSEPFGYTWATDAWVPSEWFVSQDPYWDWGILRLPDSTMGNQVGWYQIGTLTTQSLRADNFNPTITGYPGDRVPYGSMWTGSEPAFASVSADHLFYRVDTAAGQSGAAITRGNDNVIVGVHMGSISESNIGVRANASLLDDIVTGCSTIGCQLSYFVENGPSSVIPFPEATSTPGAVPPGQPGNVEAIESPHFENTWRRTDGPVTDGHISRTWMWGPAPFTTSIMESYAESPGGNRQVQYFDKSRMEKTYPGGDPDSSWFITNGLLAQELVTGQRQLGDDTFRTYDAAAISVAGDGDDPDGPTYASFSSVLDAPSQPVGTVLTEMIDRNGNVSNNPSLASYDATAAYHVPETGHSVASPFWEFMNSFGPVYIDGALVQANLFENPFYATGFPLTEAYWSTVRVGGRPQTVLVQVFERRVLTYAPDNPDGWQVEAGNVGIHYFIWRYMLQPDIPGTWTGSQNH